MFRQTVRRLAATAAKAPALPTEYTLNLSKAQGIAKGLTGGTFL